MFHGKITSYHTCTCTCCTADSLCSCLLQLSRHQRTTQTNTEMSAEVEPLCCCEYYDNQGERSHLLALCCDCEALDKAVDRLVTGRYVKDDTIKEIINVVEERIRCPWKQGAVRVPLGKTLPVILIPSLIWLASLHPFLIFITFVLILITLFTIVRKLVKYRPNTKFFLFWSYSSAGWLFYLYEVKCIGLFWDLPKARMNIQFAE